MIFDFICDYAGIRLAKHFKEKAAATRRARLAAAAPPRPDLRDGEDVRREETEAENDEIDFEFWTWERDRLQRERLRELHRGAPRRTLTGGGWSGPAEV
jgi:hypothetical protein